MRGKRLRGILAYLAYLAVATVCVLLLFEAVLRIGFDRPQGLFHIRPLDGKTLYRPNATIKVYTGPIPYTIKTNSLGFRGPEITVEKSPGTTRIVALGDSVTDGFYVENENTYPFQLEKILRQAGHKVEVVNAARGESSIDREMAIFERLCVPLHPDMVVLNFVTNDIDAIRGVSREDLLRLETNWEDAGVDSEALWVASTALGELLLDLSLRARFENYRRFDRVGDSDGGAGRYSIPGNDNYAANVAFFMEKYARKSDSILRYDTFNDDQRKTIDNYLFALEFFKKRCVERGIRVVLVYTPGYNQIHDPKASLLLRDLIADGCQRLEIPFLDLTPRLREAVKEKPVILAPLDFHPNPYGNWVMADEIATFLMAGPLAER